MLWRALRHVEEGFYIDVGAWDPTQDSVTRAFYDRGWRGINIEPAEAFFDRLMAARHRDVNLRLAVGSKPGQRTFYDVFGTGFSTLDRCLADQYESLGHVVRSYPVRTVRLSDVCAEFVDGVIHFLKIDAEGAEKDVLQGMDLARFRPWIIVIEAMAPITQTKAHEEWEQMLLDGLYDFVYFDGLNRFYVAREREDLKRCFDSPPNPFDQFLKAELATADRRAQALRIRLSEAEAQLNGVYQSRSWKITAPLRWMMVGVRRVAHAPTTQLAWISVLHRHARDLLPQLVRLGVRNLLLRRAGERLLVVHPRLKTKLVRFAKVQGDTVATDVANLPERAQLLHAPLRRKLPLAK